MAKPFPAIFFGHGNPMNALQSNDYMKGWAAKGADITEPGPYFAMYFQRRMSRLYNSASTRPGLPVKYGRVCTTEAIPYCRKLEDPTLPNTNRIVDAALNLLNF